jgi:hypothetical protein
MMIVMQCAASKRPDAGYLRNLDGKRVIFVAKPEATPPDRGVVYARPDDPADDGLTWRDKLVAYNQDPGANSLGLLPACELYQKDAYRKLSAKVGRSRFFILSAGWGLVAASFMVPYYDITFTAQAEAYKRRRKADLYDDFTMLPSGTHEPILFFGGKDYLPLFDRLTDGTLGPRIVFFNSATAPQIRNGRAVRFETSTRTNWHYECADAFLGGALDTDIKSAVDPT